MHHAEYIIYFIWNIGQPSRTNRRMKLFTLSLISICATSEYWNCCVKQTSENNIYENLSILALINGDFTKNLYMAPALRVLRRSCFEFVFLNSVIFSEIAYIDSRVLSLCSLAKISQILCLCSLASKSEGLRNLEKAKLNKSFSETSGWVEFAHMSSFRSGWKSLTPPGWDTNPSQVGSQQMMVLLYLPRKDGKLNRRISADVIVYNLLY